MVGILLGLVALTSGAQLDGPQLDDIVLKEGLVVRSTGLPGRRPIPDDPVLAHLIAGDWTPPKAGEAISAERNSPTWHEVKADKDGWFDDPALNNGYLFIHIPFSDFGFKKLLIEGDTAAYIDGSLRPGDPYSNGYLALPFVNNYDGNDLLCVGGRGRIRVRLIETDHPYTLQAQDALLPDLLTTGNPDDLWGSVTVTCGNFFTSEDLALCVSATDEHGKSQSIQAPITHVLRNTIRKVPFRIPRPAATGKSATIKVEIVRGLFVEQEKSFSLAVKKPSETHKVTFLSQIDGSVQYYSVVPAKHPSRDNALILTLHGASVEATGQAAAYAAKDWATIVAATNRRPYGFDWEDIGRLDALEVLADAKRTIPHDPNRVFLTGHSMGGHGTWSIGTLYPNLFSAIAPSAGWISFWSYAGGWTPSTKSPTLEILRRSMNVGDTLGRVTNTLSQKVFILHGDADDNVPVQQARTMRQELEKIGHPQTLYHEEPGAGHWWGNLCVDYPGIFEMFRQTQANPDPDHIDFTTQNPGVSSQMAWLTIEQQIAQLMPSRVIADRDPKERTIRLQTTNVETLTLGTRASQITIDGEAISVPSGPNVRLKKRNNHWEVALKHNKYEKGPERSGPFKAVFNHNVLFVVGTGSGKELNLQKARFDAETMTYRGNATPEVMFDYEFSLRKTRDRNVILYGDRGSNSAWDILLPNCPLKLAGGGVQIGQHAYAGGHIGGMLVYPRPDSSTALVGAIFGTGDTGMRFTFRLPIFTSGVAYPDWILFDPSAPDKVLADGFWANDWSFDPKNSAFSW